MKMCKNCKDFLNAFNDMFKPEKFWYFDVEVPYMSKFQTKQFCKTNFLDNDNKVKSCLIFYNEKLIQFLDKPVEMQDN